MAELKRSAACRMRLLARALILGAIAVSNSWAASDWVPTNGPNRARVTSVAVGPGGSGDVYAATFFGGVFKSADGGAIWIEATRRFHFDYPTVVAVSRSNQQTVYVAKSYIDGEDGDLMFDGVLKSTDSGESWQMMRGTPWSTWADDMVVDPKDDGIVYMALDGMVWRSEHNSGWKRTSDGLPVDAVTSLAIDPRNPKRLYAGTSVDGVYTCEDVLTKRWEPANTGLWDSHVLVVEVDQGNPMTLYAGTAHGGVFKSGDGGEHWERASTGLGFISINAIAIDPVDSSVVLAGTDYGVYRTADRGRSWRRSSRGLTDPLVTSLAIDPDRSEVIYAGTRVMGVYKSGDRGVSWQLSNVGLTGANVDSLAVSPADPEKIYTGVRTSGGYQRGGAAAIHVTTNGGQTWSERGRVPFAYRIESIRCHPEQPSTIYCRTDAGVMKSVDDGRHWARMMIPATGAEVDSIALDPSNPDVIYGTTGSALFATRDGGSSWRRLTLSHTPYAVAVDPHRPSSLWVAVYDDAQYMSFLYRSEDGGVSWQKRGGGLPKSEWIHQIAPDPNRSDVLYVLLDSDLYRSSDGGMSFSKRGDTPSYLGEIVFHPSAADTLYFVNYKSTDGGLTWNELEDGLPRWSYGQAVAVAPTDPPTLYLAVGYDSVFKRVEE